MQFDRKRIRAPEIKRGGPLLYDELAPLALAHARKLYSRVGHLLYDAFEQWELGFLRDRNPNQSLADWEVIARTFESSIEDHPGWNRKEVIELVCVVSTGAEHDEPSTDDAEVRKIFQRERDKLRLQLRKARPLTEAKLARLLDIEFNA